MSPIVTTEHGNSASQQPAEATASAKQGAGAVRDDTPFPKPSPVTAIRLQPFRFRDLPRELRDKIYVLALPDHARNSMIMVGDLKYLEHKPERFAVAQTCRSVRREALAAYFATCTFHIRVSRRGDTAGEAWLHDQEELSVAYMRKIIFRHASSWDHNVDWHSTEIRVDMLKAMVNLASIPSYCHACEKIQVTAKIIHRLQDIVDGIIAVEGKKRLTKETLREMIEVATNMCRPSGTEDIPDWMQ